MIRPYTSLENHALLFSDLLLKENGVSILPDYRFVVIDEAHNIEHVAEDNFGINISNNRIRFLLDGLHNPRTHKGILAYMNAEKAIDMVNR
jgi:ATP-dependent DNA helicase DinG